MFRHDEFYPSVFSGYEITQSIAVYIKNTCKQSGGMGQQELLHVPVQAFGAIVGHQNEPGDPLTMRNGTTAFGE
jgi:hypothetical protein